MYSRILIYEYELQGNRNEDGQLEWELDPEKINQLMLGLPWQSHLQTYDRRSKFYLGMSLGYDEGIPPIIDASIELTKPSIKHPVYQLEVLVTPGKLDPVQRERLSNTIRAFKGDPKLRIGWEDAIGGPRKRTDKALKRLLKQLRDIPVYKGNDDLELQDVVVSLPEALEFFGLESGSKPKTIRKVFTTKLREMQFKYHPDNAESGDEDTFLFLQKCKNVLENWIKK